VRIITRYLVTEYIKIFGLGLAAFFLVFLVIELFERINVVIVNRAPLSALFEYFLFTLPAFFSQTIHFAVLVATIITLGILSRRNELVAMRTHGIGYYRVVIPLFVIAALTSGVMFVCNETIVPVTLRKAEYIWDVRIKKEPRQTFFALNQVWCRVDGTIFNVRFLDVRKHRLKGVTIYQFEDDFVLRRRIDAPEARWSKDGWSFAQATVREFLPGGDMRTSTHDYKDIALPGKPEDFKKGMKQPEEMSYGELRDYVDALERDGYNASRYLVDLHAKMAFPFISLIMVLIGSPLALITEWKRGGGMVQGLGLSLVAGFLYWMSFSLSISLGHTGMLPPLVAAWGPNAFFGLVGGFLLESINH